MKQTGYLHGRPGYVVDHIVSLKRGGADTRVTCSGRPKLRLSQRQDGVGDSGLFHEINFDQQTSRVTRREAIRTAGKVLAGAASVAGIFQVSLGGISQAAQPTPASPSEHATDPGDKLRVATCQFR